MDKLLERTKRRAFEIYLARGADHGRDMDDWLQAEREVAAAMETAPSPRRSTRNKKTPSGKRTKAEAFPAKGAEKKVAGRP
jgi:hypothetical protein